MPAISESVSFAPPRGVKVQSKVIAKSQNNKANTQLAEARMQIVRAPVKVNGK